ncbi:hypothetical protein ACS0TY_024150 [Phlomoides rotata]
MIKTSEGAVWRRKKKRMDQEKDQSVCCFTVSESGPADTKITSNKIKEKKYALISFHQLPDYMKDNEYILNYYRSEWPLKTAFLSLFQWHNETLNVWTHLLGFMLFLGLTVANLVPVPEMADFIITIFSAQFPSSAEANVSDKVTPHQIKLNQESSVEREQLVLPTPNWPFYIFLGGSMLCLLCSTACHLLCCHSRRLNHHFLNLDYAGITVMIITSFFPPIYYIFQCTPHWQILYLTGISIMGTCTIITLLTPALSSGKCRSFRTSLFLCMGLFGLIPAVHSAIANWSDPHRNVILGYESAMAASYLIGTGFYLSRVPERWRPGCFDLAGQSHQIFHVFVVVGALAHYAAADILLKERGRMGC